jgi:predicted AAA+ superfamily ATPase
LAIYQESGAIFDEIQNTPELLSYMQEIVDTSKKKGLFIITGSQNFALHDSIAQSLSGRIGMVTLLPLRIKELNQESTILNKIFFGGYPRLYNESMKPIEFYPSYINTYIERDVRQIQNITNLSLFQTFLRMCAGRVGQVINFSSLAQDCGISHTTARQWFSLLQASYIAFFLEPFHNNFNKRLIKMPKLYFYDTGLACSLLGLETESQLETHYLKGALYENLVIVELLKARLNNGLPSNLYFWRDHTGNEIDCLGEWGGSIHAVEIKFNQTFNPSMTKNLDTFIHIATLKTKKYLLYTGQPMGNFKETSVITIDQIDEMLD